MIIPNTRNVSQQDVLACFSKYVSQQDLLACLSSHTVPGNHGGSTTTGIVSPSILEIILLGCLLPLAVFSIVILLLIISTININLDYDTTFISAWIKGSSHSAIFNAIISPTGHQRRLQLKNRYGIEHLFQIYSRENFPDADYETLWPLIKEECVVRKIDPYKQFNVPIFDRSASSYEHMIQAGYYKRDDGSSMELAARKWCPVEDKLKKGRLLACVVSSLVRHYEPQGRLVWLSKLGRKWGLMIPDRIEEQAGVEEEAFETVEKDELIDVE